MSERDVIITNPNIHDIETIYRYIREMNISCDSMEDSFFISLEEMKMFHSLNYFKINKLASKMNNSEMLGFSLFFLEYNDIYGWGIYLDDIFVIENYRRKGLGSFQICQLAKMCKENNFKFIKLIYQNVHSRPCEMYEKLGFTNSGFQLMEVFGKHSVQMLKRRFTDSFDGFDLLHDSCVSISESERPINCGVLWSVVLRDGKFYNLSLQTSYNCWLGPMLFVNNCNGDADTVTSKDIWMVFMLFLQKYPETLGIWIDVRDTKFEALLKDLGFVNITETENWTSLVLNEVGIENLLK